MDINAINKQLLQQLLDNIKKVRKDIDYKIENETVIFSNGFSISNINSLYGVMSSITNTFNLDPVQIMTEKIVEELANQDQLNENK